MILVVTKMIDSAMSNNVNFRNLAVAALLGTIVSGCTTSGGSSDDKMGRLLVAPDKFVLYSCPALAERATAINVREKELLGLMAKAGPSSGGRLVSTVAYRPEYLELRGEMNELRNAAAAKNCKFAQGPERPAGRAGDNVGR